jgi:ribosomal protein S18 acetylase RimI-like enzyme
MPEGAPFTIRNGAPDDAPALARTHVAAWEAAYRGQIPDEAIQAMTVERREEMWARHLADRPLGTLVIEEADRVVGFASFGPAEDESLGPATGEVYGIYLLPEVIGTGVGRDLFARATERLRAAGFASAILWVLETNERARRFYEAAGWRWDGATSAHRFDCAERPIVRYVSRLSTAPAPPG